MSESDDNPAPPPIDPASSEREPGPGAVSRDEPGPGPGAGPDAPARAPEPDPAAERDVAPALTAAVASDPEAAALAKRRRGRAILLGSAAGCALVLALAPWALHWRGERAPATGAATPAGRTLAPTPDAGPPAPIRLQGERTLRGRVIDDRKLPVAGARLRASSLDEPNVLPWETTSDDAGRFVLQGLVAHALSLEVTREGHDGGERVLRADDAEELVFELPRQGELLVTLRDTPGSAVADAIVTLTGPGLWPAAQLPASATGEVLFEKLAFGEYRARARRDGRIAQPSLKVRVVPGERSQLELIMEEGAELSARVIDRATKSPLAGAELSLFDPTPGVPPLSAESDAQGQVRLRGLVPGELHVQVTHAGYAPGSLDVTLPAAAPVTIEIDGEASISGSVVDEYGRPVAGALLSVSTREGLPVQLDRAETAAGLGKVGELGVTQGPVPRVPLSASAPAALGTLASQTDAQGNFRIAGLNPAPITLSAARAGYAGASLEVTDLTPHGERRNLRLVLREAGMIEGFVRDVQGRPLAGFYVSARSEGGLEQSAVTDEGGRFALHDLLGNVVVEAASSGGAALGCRLQVVPRGSARCDLTLGTALHELALRVVDEYGFGLEGVLISVSSKAGYRAATQVSRRDGSALLRELPDPPYRVEATLRGFLPALAELSEIPKELKLRLTRAASLAGTVTDSLGRAVPGAFVSTDEGDATTESDAHGNFLLTGVTPGALQLWAAHHGAGEGTSAEVRARAGQTLPAVRIVLAGRYLPGKGDEARGAHAEPPKRSDKASPARAPRVTHADFELEQRGTAVILVEVQQGGAAERQGLRSGDTLLAVDGEPVLSAAQALGMLREPPGYAAALRVVRRGAELRLRYRRPEQ
jgi:Carboxypeptidase regulatory-like domain/PDZ domain